MGVLSLRKFRHKAGMAFTQAAASTGREKGFDMNTELKNKKEDIQDSNSGS